MTVQPPQEVSKDESSPMRYLIAAIVALIGITVIAFIIFSNADDDDDSENESADEAAQVERGDDDSTDEDAETESAPCLYNDATCFPTWVGVEQGVTDDGIPTLGSPDAPVIVGVFSDFACPHCAAYEPTLQNIVDDYVRVGEAQLRYLPLTFVAGEFSVTAAEAALCLTNQDAFWQFGEVLFEMLMAQGAGAFTADNMVTIAADMGLDDAAMQDCMGSARPGDTLRATQSLQSQLGVNSTPTVAYSSDGGVTWAVLPDRAEENVRAIIESAVSFAEQ